MGWLIQDVHFGIRMLRRNRSFALIAITALALGIGATSAVFSVLYGVLLKPLPYSNPDRLVRVYQSNPSEGFNNFPLSPADFLDYRAQNRVFDSIATYIRQDQQYGGAHAERLIGMRVSDGFFRLLGFEPMLGRAFTMQEESTAGPTDVVILSYDAWKRLLGGDPHAIGKTIRLTDYPFRIVGVMPANFTDVDGARLPRGEKVDVWLPFNLLGNPRQVSRAFHYCKTIARLRPAVNIETAQTQMNVVASQLAARYPDDKNWRVDLQPLQESMVHSARPTLLILAGAVAFVLLIACVNVANLLLARAAVREKEMAIRTAVGASRMRLIRQMLAESVTLAMAGGAAGLLLAWWCVRAVAALGPERVPRLDSITLDFRVAIVTAAMSMLCGVLFGIVPALSASADARRWNRPRGAFIVAEVALTFVLLVGAGLLLRSFVALSRVDPGFNPHGVLTMNTSLTYPKLTGARRYAAFYARFVENLARLPGVQSAGAASNLPLSGGENSVMFEIEGRPRPANGLLHGHYVAVSPDYLRTIGVPLLAGRWLTVADHFDAPKVVLLNRAMALRYWPTEKACLGQRIDVMHDVNTVDSTLTIVGVVGDVKDALTDPDVEPTMYQPFLQTPSFGNYVVVRSNVARAALIAEIRQAAQEMGNDLSIQEIRSLDEVVAAAVSTQRFALQTIGSFAVIALALALIGIYGVTSYAASRRAKEIAIRSALGATPVHTITLLLADGARMIALGLLAGGFAAAVLTRLMTDLLYQVKASDPLTFAMTAALIAGVATAACVIPASKALTIDPIEMLRQE